MKRGACWAKLPFRPYTPFSHSSKRFDLCSQEREAIWPDYCRDQAPFPKGAVAIGDWGLNPPALRATSLRKGRLFPASLSGPEEAYLKLPFSRELSPSGD